MKSPWSGGERRMKNDRAKGAKDLEFYGEATFGEAFAASPSDSAESAQAKAFFGIILLVGLFYLLRRTAVPETTARLPITGEYLLYLFLQTEDRDFVIGDFTECYVRLSNHFGKRSADVWFYKQVLSSLFPLLRRALLKIGLLVWLGRILRRLIS